MEKTTTTSNVTIKTRNRKLEQFFYMHGVDFVDCSKDDEGMTVWTYVRNEENLNIVDEFNKARQRRMLTA